MNKFLKTLLISSVTFSLFSGLDEDLLAAAGAGDSVAVESAIALGADVNAMYDDGNTALIWAAEDGRIDIVRLLLNRGADIDLVNEDGNTVLNFARQRNHTEIIKILEEASRIKQLIDLTIQDDSSSCQKFVKKIKNLEIDSHEFNLIFNNLIHKINTKNSDAEMSNIRKMLIVIAKRMAIEFARYFGFGIEFQKSPIEAVALPQELVIEYLLSQFLEERLSPINLQIKIPMAYGGSENFLELVAHEYGELESKVTKIREKRESKIVN